MSYDLTWIGPGPTQSLPIQKNTQKKRKSPLCDWTLPYSIVRQNRHAWNSFVRMQYPKAVATLLFGCAKSISNTNHSNSNPHRPLLNLLLLLPFPSSTSRYFLAKRGFSGYTAEQFSDDEYDCDFDNNKVLFVLRLASNTNAFLIYFFLLFVESKLLFGW